MFYFIFNRIVINTGPSFFRKAQFLLFSFIRKVILKYSDPIIKYKIWGFDFKIPFSYNLPVILNNHTNYNTNLLRITTYVARKYTDVKLIDVGANIGDTVGLIKSKLDIPILSIEGDKKYYDLLLENTKQFQNVVCKNYFLSDVSSFISGKLKTNLGTGSIVMSDGNKIETVTLDNLIDRNEMFKNSKIIKIDTDGYDYKILRGSSDYLLNSKPVIFIEYDPVFHKLYGEDSFFIFKFLEPMGYSKVIFYDNFGDYLVSLSINDLQKIYELTNYFTERNHLLYCDLCFFHSEDEDVFEHTREEELKYFLANRKN